MNVSGSDSGAPGGVPVGPDDEYGEYADYSEYGEDQTTTALPRPPRGARPGDQLPFAHPADRGPQPTTAIPRRPGPPQSGPDERPALGPARYRDATPVERVRPAPPYRPSPPVGPSWAGPSPDRGDQHRAEQHRSDQNLSDQHRRDQNRPNQNPQQPYRTGPSQRDPGRRSPQGYDARTYGQDTYDQNTYDQDGYDQDSYDEYGRPRYRDRQYGTPRYGTPQQEQPRYGEPGYQETGYHQPPPRGSHLPPYQEPMPGSAGTSAPGGPRSPRKLTVTRVAALRSRELTTRGVQMFHRATTADGADKSGLTALTYAVMANYAVDAILAVALAGTLFFAAATAESTGRVLLYLVITVAPFAFIAPFIGPMLDRLQSGRRLALGLSSFGRALLAILMAFNFSHFNPWVIYPCALGNLVLSKAFGVLKAALTPRVLPEQITLVKTNARLTTFGMIAGGVAGAVAAGLSKIAGSPGALFFMAICAIAGGVLCLRIPAWVESTEGEVPVKQAETGTKKGFPQIVVVTLWANSMIRVETGFLALFIAFVVKSQYPQPAHSAFTQLLLLGVIGAAAGVGGFIGNTMGARLTLSAPETISIFALVGVVVSTLIAVLVPGLTTAAIVGFVGSTSSSLAKVSLDSVIQNHLPEESRASGFGKSESVLQLGWVFGGVVGLLLGGVWTFGHANVYAIGFGTITLLLLVGLAQSWLVRSGKTMLPALPGRGGRRAGKKVGRDPKGGSGAQHTDRLTRPGPTPVTTAGAAPSTRRRTRKAGR